MTQHCTFTPGLDYRYCKACNVYVPTDFTLQILQSAAIAAEQKLRDWEKGKTKGAKTPKSLKSAIERTQMELQQAKSLTSDHTKFAEPAKVVPSIFKPAIPITQSVTPSEYSLTDSEKDEIKANYAARLIPAARELETLVQPPYSVFCDTRFPDCLFVLCNEEGDVIKEDPSPRVVKNYYERICLT